jgi:hypothetical protein
MSSILTASKEMDLNYGDGAGFSQEEILRQYEMEHQLKQAANGN